MSGAFTRNLDPLVRQRARMLAEEMGIGDKLKRRANDLSQGEKQRAAICRALLPQPRLILADEATGNLDPANKTSRWAARSLDEIVQNCARPWGCW